MSTRPTSTPTIGSDLADKQPIQLTAAAVGAVFLLVGVLGFVPGITTNTDELQFAGHESEAELLGIFAVNILHNIVHLAFGALGIAAARTVALARGFLLYGGAIYLVLWAYGLLIDLESELNFVNLNTADNWLHFSLGAVMIAAGLLVPRLRR